MTTRAIVSGLLALLLAGCANTAAEEEDQPAVGASAPAYVELTDERYAEIQALMPAEGDWNPIRLQGIPKEERVAFYVKSYGDETVKTWVEYAHEKLTRSEDSRPTPEQNAKLEPFLTRPKTRENVFQFMMLLTDEQIEAIDA